ncbi:Snf7-domain-containing protein [Cunninghamella echinulata]|nr:Snf7-domain-containing protein [Cunninghamella echinulata]
MYDTIIKTPVRWSLSTIVNSTTTTTSSSLYVCIPSIQVISETILQRYRKEKSYLSWINKILTFNEFCSKYEKYNSITLTEGDIWLLLKYMNSHFGVTLDPEVQGYGKTHLAIKFPKYNEHDLKFHSTPEDITDNDKAVISLKSTCEALHDQVKDLELKMEELVKQCLVHSTKKQKTQALYLLKRKKQLEQILDRRLKSLDTIETILLKIDSSHNDLQVMQAFNVGADTLKHILSNNNITVTSVDETIQKIQDALEDQKRIEDAITSGMKQATYSYDNDGHDEIEDETSKTILKEKRHWDQVDEDDDKSIDVIKPVETTYPLRSDSELARLHTILSELPEIPIRPPPKSKQRRQQRQQQLA